MDETLLGKNITGRSTAGYDIRLRPEVYSRETGVPHGFEMEYNPYGVPKTDEQRMMTHYAKYGTTNLPIRGTGLQPSYGEIEMPKLSGNDFLMGLVVGFIVGALVLTATGRGLMGAAGERATKYVRGR
jgi:hypothetical protein